MLPRWKADLCKAGFREVRIQQGRIFEIGHAYSIGSPETTEERQARLEKARAYREEYVHNLEEAFRNDPDVTNVTVENDELVLTMPAIKLTPEAMRNFFEKHSELKRRLCTLGLRGARIKTDSNKAGTFLSFGCGRDTH